MLPINVVILHCKKNKRDKKHCNNNKNLHMKQMFSKSFIENSIPIDLL